MSGEAAGAVPDVSVVVPVRNDAARLAVCLAGLRASTLAGHEVIVVDDASTDSSARVAESCKLLENVFHSVNIALVNELKTIFDRMNIDVWEVIEAAKTKPFGFMPFYPGPGLGGHCIPLDPFYLSWKAAEHGAWVIYLKVDPKLDSLRPDRRFKELLRSVRQDS